MIGANLAHAGSSSSTPAVERNANAGEERGKRDQAEDPDVADEADSHEDAPNAQHECPPDCDAANGETP